MRQITLRVPNDLHELATSASEAQGQSLNSFAIAALLAQVRAKSYGEWRQMVDNSHRAAGYRGLPPEGRDTIRTLTGDETE
jgi:uncharacterized protein (DUF1778 family)